MGLIVISLAVPWFTQETTYATAGTHKSLKVHLIITEIRMSLLVTNVSFISFEFSVSISYAIC